MELDESNVRVNSMIHQRPDLVIDGAMTGGRNWTQQQQGYVALRKAFDQGA